MINTYVKLPELGLKNPAMPASGTLDFGDVPAAKKFDLGDLGAMIIKITILHAVTGNPQPQITVSNTEVLNSVGLANPGIGAVIEDKLASLHQSYPILPITASVGGGDEAGHVGAIQKLSDSGLVSALEINVSCPNVNQGSMSFGIHPDVVESLTKKIKAVANTPIYVKLTPNVIDTIQIAKATEEGGADGLSLINTLLRVNIDIKTRKPVLGHNVGGLSGEAIKSIAPRAAHQVRRSTSLSIVGMGGISSVQDVIKFMFAGANAIVVGTVHFKDSIASKHIAGELPNELEKLSIENTSNLVNQAEFN